ncbi:LOW QUALITY PROTEIN: protein ALTERED XYLOGLUCAN 4-like [Brachypodium distachyon]|uniref:LOW QUALITY PROTEIN: protein ALTERED XYLOGLUCAN 4-like n=1 Tax=Brachypodium distachyon TaxID=15368 RepID=UPI00052FFFB4|nr:LOW QUALITY PROTEIN: protein ALTERED XYLOGLUCAN 4-like [Brachypodium distachyon]|eukprot:XP_010240003.1 LOW QUALITY PROTEIN: protein ALTERED XYLOGLUCAN 4-like [Brachypodium distachyon]
MQVEVPAKVHSDTTDKFITWHFRSHNFTLMALWTKFLVEESQREINGTLVESHDIHLDKLDARLAANLHELNILVVSSSRWFFRTNYLYEDGKLIGCIYCSEDNITSFTVLSAIQRVFKTTLSNLNKHQEPRLQLTVVRTATPAHFENGLWDTGGSCNRTEPVGEDKAMTSTIEWAIRNVQVEEVNRAQKEKKHKGGMNIEILDITKAMSMRPDAHPGIHGNNQWMRGYSDCSHWYLPGPIDMWNELLLAVLNKYRKYLVDQ